MFATNNVPRPSTKFDDMVSKKMMPHHPTTSPATYQNLTVIKRLSKAKFPVFLAASKSDRKNYAMKIFAQKDGKPHPYYKNEIRFSSLKHPNVIEIVYHEDEKDTLYKDEIKKVSFLLMEFAPHGDFFDFITKNREQLDERLARTYFRQLIDGIEYLHASGVAHLDLKPENLLIGADFNLKIADFDLSHVYGDSKILSRGTKYYRGPEFFKSGPSDPQLKNPSTADIYSAGAVLFILKSGGIYPHSENNTLEGVDLVNLLYHDNGQFWKQHTEIQDKPESFFDRDFKELFNNMVKFDPQERWTISKIKESKWYNGPVYTPMELQRKMKKILKC